MKTKKQVIEILTPLFRLTLLLIVCAKVSQAAQPGERQAKAMAMWKEHCKTAGQKIHRTVEDVEGIYVLKLRSEDPNHENQFALDDPYGKDLGGKLGYVGSFIRGEFQATHRGIPKVGSPPRLGYRYVEAKDPADGKRYRYTGRLEEPWQTNKAFLKGYIRFVIDRALPVGNAPRYGVTYDDISTREDREYWIAGSSLKVIDLQTNEVIAERIGYMVDWAQGSQAGGRSPWLFAADNSCPQFPGKNASGGQSYQALDFVEKVLKPAP